MQGVKEWYKEQLKNSWQIGNERLLSCNVLGGYVLDDLVSLDLFLAFFVAILMVMVNNWGVLAHIE